MVAFSLDTVALTSSLASFVTFIKIMRNSISSEWRRLGVVRVPVAHSDASAFGIPLSISPSLEVKPNHGFQKSDYVNQVQTATQADSVGGDVGKGSCELTSAERKKIESLKLRSV